MGFVHAFAVTASGSFKREHTPVRECFSLARQILYDQKNLEKGASEIKRAAHDKLHASLFAKRGTRDIKQALGHLKEALVQMGTEEILICQDVLSRIITVIKELNGIRVQLPEVQQFMDELNRQLQQLLRLINNIGSVGARFGQAAEKAGHRRHFFARHLFKDDRTLLRHEVDMDRAVKAFDAGLRKHLKTKLENGFRDFKEAVSEIFTDLKHIFADTACIVYIILAASKDILSKERELEKKVPDMARNEQWVQVQFAEIMKAWKKELSDLSAVHLNAAA